jgi:hypothetical protein
MPGVKVTSKDGRTISKVSWIACDVGNSRPGKHGQHEWIVCRTPLTDGWTPFDLSLREVIERLHFGQEEGLQFSELMSIRLRGSISVSPIGIYREAA